MIGGRYIVSKLFFSELIRDFRPSQNVIYVVKVCTNTNHFTKPGLIIKSYENYCATCSEAKRPACFYWAKLNTVNPRENQFSN